MSGDLSTRDRLIETARDLFLLNGYNATGIAEIVERAGVRPGSLYYFFPTKEDLLLAVLDWYHVNIYEGLLQPIWGRIDDPIERIFGLLDGYRQMLLLTAFDQGCPIGNLSLEIGNSHPRARELMVVNFKQWAERVGECLHAANGKLPRGMDVDGLASHVLVVMEGAVMLARAYRSIEPFDQSLVHLRDYFDRLIADGTEWATPVRGRFASERDL